MATNPYEPPQSLPATQGRLRRWKWRIILPLVLFLLVTFMDVIAVRNGLSLRATAEEMTVFENVVCYLNFPGIFTALFFGDLLHDPEDITTQNRNLFLFCFGGILAWTLLAFMIGSIADIARRKQGG